MCKSVFGNDGILENNDVTLISFEVKVSTINNNGL